MKRTAHQIARLGALVAIAACLAGCNRGTLGDPDAGGAGPISGTAARGASGIGGAGVPSDGVGGGVGFGGVGGVVGGGGRGGGNPGQAGTGQGMILCPPPSPPVCGASCGNGRIDSCIGALAPECIPYALREECDGDDLGPGSCAQLGFPSGKLVCDKTCSFASGTGCSECVPMASSVVSCGVIASVAPAVANYAMAGTDSEVGLVEAGYDDLGGMTLSFRRLTPSLATASSTTLLDTSQSGPLAGAFIDGVAVAPLPSGWVIAGCLSGQMLLFTVDAAGVNSTRAPLPLGDRGCAYAMVLAARPDGGPLLVWAAGYGVRGALIAADGQKTGPLFDIVTPPADTAGMFDAAWVGDAFNVAVSAYVPPIYNLALRIVRVDVNGALTSRDQLIDEFEEAPRIARGAMDTRVTYAAYRDFGGTDVKWRRFGSTGEPLAAALLAEALYGYTPSPAVAFGADTLVLLADDLQVSSLSITRVGADGQLVTRPYEIVRAPTFRIGNHDMVRRGPDAIVSWLTYGGPPTQIGLARITP